MSLPADLTLLLSHLANAVRNHEVVLEAVANNQATQLETQAQIAQALADSDAARKTSEDARAAASAPVRIEGLRLPEYHGRVDESIDLYIHRVNTFFAAKNITPCADPATERRCLAIVVANLQGLAASWYLERVARSEVPTSLLELEAALRAEFEPPDLQERLRDQLYTNRQSDCADLLEYIGRFRGLMCQVREMSDLDKTMHFMRGLNVRTREAVQYRRPPTTTLAIQWALEFERAHSTTLRADQPAVTPPRGSGALGGLPLVGPLPPPPDRDPYDMEIDFVKANRARDTEQRRCYNCNRRGHLARNCRSQRRGSSPGRRARRDHTQAHLAMSEVESPAPAPPPADDDDEEIMWYGVNTTSMQSDERAQATDARAHHLVIKKGYLDGRPVRILLDSGATDNLIRPHLVSWDVLKTKQVKMVGFDGLARPATEATDCIASVDFVSDLPGEGFTTVFTTWDLGPKNFDVILGKPWFHDFNPVIDWRSHAIVSIDRRQDLPTYDRQPAPWAKEAYVLKVSEVPPLHEPPAEVKAMLDEFADVLPTELPDELPPSRVVDFEMKMKPDARPQNTHGVRMAKIEQDAVASFIAKLEKKGWIELSASPWVSNMFGVPKHDDDGSTISRSQWLKGLHPAAVIRWVLDYRHVNSQTEVPAIPLPNAEDLFNRMAGCRIFTKMDLASGYHQMLVVPASRKYTAFRTHRETYQWCVAPMGLAGMPGTWSRLMRALFDRFDFVVVYMDDICIFSATIEEHVGHLRAVLEVLRAEKLYARPSKCVFGAAEVSFLGHRVSAAGLHVDSSKVRAIEDWPEPAKPKELVRFLGLCGYYRKFIARFAELVLPLSELVKPDCRWHWGAAQSDAFKRIKVALQQAPVLQLPDWDRSFVVATDASGFCCGAVLAQKDANGDERPVAFLSKKFGVHEVGWPAHEKELFAIKLALEKWRHYLYGRHFDVYTDNSACQWFLQTPVLSAKMTRWLDFFSRFTFTLHHRRGVDNVVADALSRPPQRPQPVVHACSTACVDMDTSLLALQTMDELRECSVAVLDGLLGTAQQPSAPPTSLSVPHVVTINSAAEVQFTAVAMDADLRDRLVKATANDSTFDDDSKYRRHKGLTFVKATNHLWRLCIPNEPELRGFFISQAHDTASTAHPGSRRTYLLLAQWYYWPKMKDDVALYVATCETCARYKSNTLRANGTLMPIPAPPECWHTISIDWVTGLPVSRGYDAIMTVVDKLSKRAKYIATHTTATAPETAILFFDHVVRHHGLPAAIISDRDPKFTSTFWRELMKIMGVQQCMTTAGRAQADGATERQNRTLEDSLRCETSYLGTDWADHLATIEYAHQALVQTSTGVSPFELDTGRILRNPLLPLDTPNALVVNMAQHRQDLIARAQANLLQAQARQKKYYDLKRSSLTFSAGEWVLLATRDIPLKHSQLAGRNEKKKMVPRFIGPFRIVKMINSNAAQLDLPGNMKSLHEVFNVDRLKKYQANPEQFAQRPIPKAVPVVLEDGEELHIVEALLGRRQRNRRVEYLVKWHGLPDHESTWESERNIKHVSHFKLLLKDLVQRLKGSAPARASGGRM